MKPPIPILLAALTLPHLAHAAIQVQITSTPPFGQSGPITGQVTGITDFQNYAIAPYLFLEGVGWYNKPTDEHPTVPLNPDGTFSANVSTGPNDPLATIFYAGLVPAGSTPPQSSGLASLPPTSNFLATASKERYPATFSFAGRNWAAKGTYPAGPRSNSFSASNSDVWSDTAGLHLTIHNQGDHWSATEVILPEHLGYGTYTFKTRYNANALAPNLTFGAFTWDPYGLDLRIPTWPQREIDFEDSRWNNPSDPTNSQSLVQPDTANQPHRATIPDGNITITRSFTWRPGSVEFLTLLGDKSPQNYSTQDVLDHWTFQETPGHLVPTPDTEMFHLNLWLNNGSAPSNGLPAEVLIADFSYSPTPLPGDANRDGHIGLDDYLAIDHGYLLGGSGWANGDFNGDDKVNAADYAIIDAAYRAQPNSASEAAAMTALHNSWFAADQSTAVPEPTSLLFLALGAMGLCRRFT